MTTSKHIQLGLGALLFTTGFVLEVGGVLALVSSNFATFFPASPLQAHLAAAFLVAIGGAMVATTRHRFPQTIGVSVLFSIFALLLPVIAPLAILVLTTILFWHTWHKTPTKIALEKVSAPATLPASPCPVTEPLVGMLHRLPAEDLQEALLGMDHMPPRFTRPILKALQKHSDVRVLLYANGLLNDHLNTFEKHLAALQTRLNETPDDTVTLTAMVETYASLIEHKLIPADETSQTAKRALALAETALRIDPNNVPILTAKTRFELLISDFSAAYTTIQALYALPDCFEAARCLHGELLFAHSASRPVRPKRNKALRHRTRQSSLN